MRVCLCVRVCARAKVCLVVYEERLLHLHLEVEDFIRLLRMSSIEVRRHWRLRPRVTRPIDDRQCTIRLNNLGKCPVSYLEERMEDGWAR